MFTSAAVFLACVLPALGAVTPRQPINERAGAAIGEILAGAPISNISVRADNVNQCQKATISWTGATDPVSLFVALGGLYVGETPITTINDLRGGSTSYLVNQAAGQTMEFRVTDAKGSVAYVQNIKIGGGDDWCLSATGNTGSTTSKKASAPSSTQQAWSDSASATWAPEETAAPWSQPDAVAQAAATTTSKAADTPAPSAKTSTTTKTSTSNSSTTSTIVSGGPPTRSASSGSAVSTTSADPSATLANAGAAASASKTGGATRDSVSRGSVILALTGVVAFFGLI